MRILYKILFEVKVLHEYYLTDPPAKSIFAEPDQDGRIHFLLERYNADVASVNEDVSFTLSPRQQALFRSYHLVLINSYSGFQVAVEVVESRRADGSTVYRPLVELPDDLNLLIGISEIRSFMDQITNGRLLTAVQAARYFSNEKVFDAKVFPCLSSPVQGVVDGYPYEQGELASFGPNDVRTYYYYTIGDPAVKDQWLKIAGTDFSGEQDRLVVPLRFYYRFAPGDMVSNVVFELKDGNGQLVDRRNLNGTTPLGKVLLDFTPRLRVPPPPRDPPLLTTLPWARVGDGICYTLSVTGDNGYNRSIPLIFYQPDAEEAPVDHWGWIQIQKTVSDPLYNLLDGDGLLFTRTLSDGTRQLHPIFEIRLKSRCTFWRYRNDAGKALQGPGPTISPMLDVVGGDWISKEPRFLTYRPTYFLNPNDNTYYYLPNPDSDTLAEVNNRQFFSNILVAKSNLFPTP